MIMNFNKFFLCERSPYLGEPPKSLLGLGAGLAILGGAQLVGGALGGLFNNKSVDKTNQANLSNMQLYNQNQIDLAKMNNKFNRDMWLEQQAYNTPANQLQRYRDAGINPYMALGNISSGNAESAVQGTLPNTSAPPNMIPRDYSFVGDTVSRAASTALDAAAAVKTANESTGQKLDNDFNAETFMSRVKERINQGRLSGYVADLNKGQLNLFNKTYSNQVKLSDMSVRQAQQDIIESQSRIAKMKAETSLVELSKILTSTQTEKLRYYLDKEAPLQLENLRKSGRLIDQQALTEISKRALNRSQISLNYMNVETLDNVLSYQLQSMALDNQSKAISNGFAIDTYAANLNKSFADAYKTGFYDQVNQNSFNIGVGAGKGKSLGINVGMNGRNTKNFLYDKGYGDYLDKSQISGRRRGESFVPPTIKRKSSRYYYKWK